MIHAEALTRKFDNVTAVDNVSFTVGAGEIFAFLGPNAGQDGVLFNIWWMVDEDMKLDVFENFEQTMCELNARPHWGKLHRRQDIEYLRRVYPEWEKFEAVRAKFDPDQLFDPPHRQSHAEAVS